MRVLIAAAPFHGHVNAVLPLARAALRAGHEIVVATGADLAEDLGRRGVPTWPVGPTRIESGMPGSLTHFWRTGGERASDLLPLAERWRPDLVVAEEMELGGAIVAARLGVRLVVHGLGISAAGDPAAFAPALDDLGTRWAAPDLAESYHRATYVTICPPSLQAAEAARRTLLPMRPGLGEPGPGEQLPAALEAMPYQHNVHLTLGTVFHQRRPEAMRVAIAGLRELPMNLVATLGPGVSTDSFGPQPAHVLLAEYLPHSLLLPRCRLVVSQGGAGILLGALAHGLPQLVLPQGADQFGNGEALARSGAGMSLADESVDPAAITAAAHTLLTDPRFAIAADLLRREIAAMPTADDLVEELVS